MRAMCGVQLKDRKRSKELMLCLNEIIDHLTKANSVRWYGHVLMRADVRVLRRALDFEGEGKRNKLRPMKT